MRLLSSTGPGRCLPLGELPHVPFKDSGAAIPHLPRHLSVIHLVLLWVSQVFIMHRAVFPRHVVFFFLVCANACAFLNKSPAYKYNILVTFHAIWYVFTELSTPAWQKDVRDITYFLFEAMEDAKKESKQPERED